MVIDKMIKNKYEVNTFINFYLFVDKQYIKFCLQKGYKEPNRQFTNAIIYFFKSPLTFN